MKPIEKKIALNIMRDAREQFDRYQADYNENYGVCSHGVQYGWHDEIPCNFCHWGMTNREAMYYVSAEKLRNTRESLQLLEEMRLSANYLDGIGNPNVLPLNKEQQTILSEIRDLIFDLKYSIRNL